MIFDLLKDLNQDCNFTENINESSHVQSLGNTGNSDVCNSAVTNINTTEKTSKKYKTFVECILCEFDPIYSGTENLDSNNVYLNGKIIEICSHIEEKRDTCYDNYSFNLPADITVLKDGSFYVADGYGNSRIIKFTKEGDFITKYGTYGSSRSQFIIPHGIDNDEEENIYVADRENNRIKKYNFLLLWLVQFLHYNQL